MNDTTAPATTKWVHYDDDTCDLFTVDTALDLDRRMCGHGLIVTEVYTEDHQEPVDPDTVYLSRAAKDFLQVIRYSDSVPALNVAMNIWTSLTGLTPADATDYAERLATRLADQEVTAHVAPF